jgi:hypothetical protein
VNRADRLDELFVRYWYDILTEAEATELTALLRDDIGAQSQFQFLSVQAIVAAEAVPLTAPAEVRPPLMSRRRMLGLAAGTAAAVGAAVTLLPVVRRQTGAVLVQITGRVLIRSQQAVLGMTLLPGDTIAVEGVDASAVFRCPEGSELTLTGGTEATLEATGKPQLVVHRGGVGADLKDEAPGQITLATGDTSVAPSGGPARLTLDRSGPKTEVGVFEGRVRMSRRDGQTLFDVNQGEVGVVSPNRVGKETRPVLTTNYAWDFTRPLPPDWQSGKLLATPEGPAMQAEYWSEKFTPPSYAVAGPKSWTCGHALVYPDSVLRLRYRVKRRGMVQVYFVVRPDPINGPTAMVFNIGMWTKVTPLGQWQTTEYVVSDLRMNMPWKVSFDPPWIAFQFGINSFKTDLGLEVSSLDIHRPAHPLQG